MYKVALTALIPGTFNLVGGRSCTNHETIWEFTLKELVFHWNVDVEINLFETMNFHDVAVS